MTYLRLKKINAIKKKISRKHVLELPFSEICLYVEHRISKLLSQAIAASKLEIKYNLCEVGPGRSRLDPWTVEIVLNSQLFQKTSFLEKTTVNDILFFSRIKESNLAVKEVIKQKAPLLAKTMDMITEQNISIELLNQFKKSPAVFHINEEYFDKNKRFLEFAFSINEKDFILRLYNIIDWIYPNSTEIWSLVHKARQNHLQPIMLAPHIHGSCFLIFKRYGIFGRSLYRAYINSDIPKLPDESELLQIYFSFGRFEKTTNETINSVDELSSLLSTTIPSYYLDFKNKFKKSLPSEDLITLALNCSDPNIHNQIISLEHIADLLSLPPTHEIRSMVKRYNSYLNPPS